MERANRALQAEASVRIDNDADIVLARQKGRELAGQLGFSATDLVLITTTISELARNIVLYAKNGEVRIAQLTDNGKDGVVVIAQDEGPGIADIDEAIRDGYSTSGSLGLGLPGIRRLMDEVEIHSALGQGTTVIAKKWKR